MVLITPLSKTNLLYREKQKAFQCLIILYKMFHIVYGLHFGFMKFNLFKINISPKIVAIIQCTLYCALAGKFFLYSKVALDFFIWFIAFLFQYGVCTLLLTFIKEDSTFCNLFYDLRTIDIGLKVNSASYNLELKLLLSILTSLLFRISLSLLNCMYFKLCDSVLWSLVLYLFIFFGVDVVLITCAFMFYAINCRLEKLASRVMTESSNFLSIQYLYKSIVDIAEKHKAGFGPVFIILLLFNIPEAMATIYVLVQTVRDNKSLLVTFSPQCIVLFEMITLATMPAFCAGMLATQAENIKIILHNKLLLPQVVSDAVQMAEIERFIRYVEARDCRFTLCKVVPLDAHLLGMVLGFCVTYLIVIVQFTHIY